MKQPDRQERPELRSSVIQEICATLGRMVPPGWNAVTLTLTPTSDGLGLSHEISSPEGHTDAVIIPMELLEATQKLERCWVERDATFKQAVIFAARNCQDWNIRIDYDA
jgi:hypothetical protein